MHMVTWANSRRGAFMQAEHIIEKHAATLRYWARHGPRLVRAGVTLDRLRAAVVTVSKSSSFRS